MPRPNQPRTLQSEQNLARRIAHERERRGWTYEGTAKRMTDAGCAIQPTAIYKIEKADPPRRISVDELVGFSQVFDVALEELLLPPELAAEKEVQRLALTWTAARAAADQAKEAERAAWATLRQYAIDHPDVEQAVATAFEAWADEYREPQERPVEVAAQMATLLQGDDERARPYVERLLEAHDAAMVKRPKARTRRG